MPKPYRSPSGRRFRSKAAYQRSLRGLFYYNNQRPKARARNKPISKPKPKPKPLPKTRRQTKQIAQPRVVNTEERIRLQAENTKDGALVTVGVETDQGFVQMSDTSTDPLKEVEAVELGGTVIVEGTTTKDRKVVTVVGVTPTTEQEVKKL